MKSKIVRIVLIAALPLVCVLQIAVRPARGEDVTPVPAPAVQIAQATDMPGMKMPGMDGSSTPTEPAAVATPTATPSASASPDATASSDAAPGAATNGMKNVPTVGDRESMGIPPDWPSPVDDQAKHTFWLFDTFELQSGGDPSTFRHDFLGWTGGDINRFWFKSLGRQNLGERDGKLEFQALYGKLISPYFDLQAGLRFDTQYGGSDASRVFAVLSLQGLSPYRFEIEPALFVDQNGKVSVRFTGTYDLLITQRLVLQPRLEADLAFQQVPRFGVGSGLNEVELSLRLRYEIRRKVGPYVGVFYGRSFGDTAKFARRDGEKTGGLSFLSGLRFWF